MIERRISPAGDPFYAAGIRRRTHEECIAAMHEDEARLGRPMSQREREGFVRGFHAPEYRMEIASLAARGLLDEEDREEEE